MAEMTPRQRMMAAMRRQTPDRVPAAPDISNMIPCKLTGKPFWDIYRYNSPPLWEAYIEAIKRYGMDGWFIYGELEYKYSYEVIMEQQTVSHTKDRLTERKIYHTPAGDLTETVVYPVKDPPTCVEKMVKNLKNDFHALEYILQTPIGYSDGVFQKQKSALGELGVMCVYAGTPGMHSFFGLFEGGLEGAAYAMYDYPDLFGELIRLQHQKGVAECKFAIEAGADSILTGGSGSITLSSPELWRKHALPAIKEITKLCKEAGVISGIHSCGLEMDMVKACALETDLDYINPLEIPPMGDCTLKEARKQAGGRLCLMGNLHTTDVMLNGSVRDVRRESLKALLDAGRDGAFILSTGDQCGRDTPEDNIRAMVETMREFGAYPIDAERIERELSMYGG